jgi:hypothetical protein
MVAEKNDILGRLSAKHKEIKDLLLSQIEWNTLPELLEQLRLLQKGFNDEIAISLGTLQTSEQLMSFWNSHHNLVDIVLKDTDWFSTTPAQMGIKSIHIYVIKGTKRALKETCDLILKEL